MAGAMDDVAAPPDSSVDPLAAWSFEPGRTLVRQSCNEVFHCQRNGQEFFGRITFADHRVREEIDAEVAWMQALHAGGTGVVALVPSHEGAFVQQTRYK